MISIIVKFSLDWNRPEFGNLSVPNYIPWMIKLDEIQVTCEAKKLECATRAITRVGYDVIFL